MYFVIQDNASVEMPAGETQPVRLHTQTFTLFDVLRLLRTKDTSKVICSITAQPQIPGEEGTNCRLVNRPTCPGNGDRQWWSIAAQSLTEQGAFCKAVSSIPVKETAEQSVVVGCPQIRAECSAQALHMGFDGNVLMTVAFCA